MRKIILTHVLVFAIHIVSYSQLDFNIVALWHFDEGSGNILHDISNYHNDGQIHNAEWVPGKFGTALRFDGQTSYVILPNSPSLKFDTEFTIEAWISIDSSLFAKELSPYENNSAIVSNLGPYPSGGGYEYGFSQTYLNLLVGYRGPIIFHYLLVVERQCPTLQNFIMLL